MYCREGYAQTEKLARDDHGVAWRKKRVAWCKKNAKVTAQKWKRKLQGVGDFRLWKYYPSALREKFVVKSAPRTIMSKRERKKPDFQKPRKHIFKRKEYRKVTQVSDVCLCCFDCACLGEYLFDCCTVLAAFADTLTR